MELISGTIHSISDGTVKTGHFTGSLFKTITLTTGNKLSAFDLPFVADVEIGKEYTFPVEQKGTYVNIVGTVTPVIQQSAEETGVPEGLPLKAKSAEEVLPKVHTPTDERAFKNRISAISSAVEFIVGVSRETNTPFSIGEAITAAEGFLKFINGEEEELPY